MMAPDRLSRWSAVLPLVLLPVVFAIPLLLGEVFLFRDLLHFVIPEQLFAAREVAAGRIPEWNPALFGGAPFLADPSEGAFYPPNRLFHFLPPEQAGTLWVLLHLPLAAFGAIRLTRALGAPPLAASAAATVYVTCGYVLSMHGSHLYFAAVAWLPLTAALLFESAERRTARAAALAAGAIGLMILNGEFQALGFALGLATCLALADGKPVLARLGAIAGAGALGAALGAIQLVPTLRLVSNTVRASGLSVEEASMWSLHPARWLELLAPTPFGVAYPNNTQWSHWLDGVHAAPWGPVLYLGPAVLALGALAAVRRRDRKARVLAGLFVLALLLAAGRNLPLFALWHRFVPGASFFRYPEKFVALASVCAAALAGLALAELERAPEHRQANLRWLSRAAGAVGLVLLAAAGAAVALAGRLEPFITAGLALNRATIDAPAAAAGLTGALVHAGLIALALALVAVLAKTRPALAGPGMIALLALDGASVGLGALSYGSAGLFAAPPPLAGQVRAAAPPGSAGRYLRSPTCHFSGGGDPAATQLERVRAFEWASGKQNFLTRFGLADALGYGASPRTDQLRVWQTAARASPEWAARLFGAAVRIDCPGGAIAASPIDQPLPRAFVSPRARSVEFAALLEAVAQPATDLLGEALVEGPAPAEGSGGPAVVRDVSPQQVEVETRAGGTLVLLDTFAEGWTASLDGQPAPIHRAYGLYRAVAVPEGTHVVTFHYRTPGLAIGAVLSAIAGLLVAAALLRRPRAPAG